MCEANDWPAAVSVIAFLAFAAFAVYCGTKK